MPEYLLAIIFLAWMAVFLAFIILLRYIDHRERMAMIEHGIDPLSLRRPQRRGNGVMRGGLITAMVGLSLTIGLYPLGYILPANLTSIPFHLGPWLLPGLIPLGVGIALTVSHYLSHDTGERESKEEVESHGEPKESGLGRDEAIPEE